MEKKNTKAAARKAAAKSATKQTPATQVKNDIPDQTLNEGVIKQVPDETASSNNNQPEASNTPPVSTTATEKVPVKPAKDKVKGTDKAPAKTIRETATQAVAKQVFKSHPEQQTVYVTSDGTPFFVKCDADNHGRTLDDKLIVTVTNENNKA